MGKTNLDIIFQDMKAEDQYKDLFTEEVGIKIDVTPVDEIPIISGNGRRAEYLNA